MRARFPDALVLLDWACPELAQSAELHYVRAQSDDLLAVRGTYPFRATSGPETWRRSNFARWDGIAWVRCSRAFDSDAPPELEHGHSKPADAPEDEYWYSLKPGRRVVVTGEQIARWRIDGTWPRGPDWVRMLLDYHDDQVSVRVVGDDGIVYDCYRADVTITVLPPTRCDQVTWDDELGHQRWHEYHGTACPDDSAPRLRRS